MNEFYFVAFAPAKAFRSAQRIRRGPYLTNASFGCVAAVVKGKRHLAAY